METLAIHWYKWWFIDATDAIVLNDANGTNVSSGVIDFIVQWHLWNVEDTSPFNGEIGANDATGADEAIGANFTINANVATFANETIFTIVAIRTIVAIGVIFTIGTIVWPMYHHCDQWIVIVANVATVAIGHHWCHQLLLDIITLTSPRNGANGTI